MTEQMQEAKANPAAQKAKAKSHSSNTIQTSSEIISVDEPENALPEVSLADLPQLLQTACLNSGIFSLELAPNISSASCDMKDPFPGTVTISFFLSSSV